ncbi:MotE family protein [Jiella sp. M17.18]|uniref:MotE family protein n=1 Tax=Jiella sp. M17.18 TaxID=3234247 RepID=UPI0034DF41B5
MTKQLFCAKKIAMLMIAASALGASVGEVGASGAQPPAAPPVTTSQGIRILDENGNVATAPKPTTEVEKYCLNIADKAQDARYALQQDKLKQLEGAVSKQIDALEAKRKEYQDWLAERKKFLDSASTIVVDIYAKMKADAAAAQLAQLGTDSAAAVIIRLKARQASDILSQMQPEVAAAITKRIVDKTSSGGETGKPS